MQRKRRYSTPYPKPPQRPERWKLVPYIEDSGKSRVMDFLEALRTSDDRRKRKGYEEFYQELRPTFEDIGPMAVGPPRWEGVRGGLGEIRWSNFRLYCSIESQRRVFMYMGAIKTWRIFLNAHRAFCELGRADVLNGNYDQTKREAKYLARQQRGNNGSP